MYLWQIFVHNFLLMTWKIACPWDYAWLPSPTPPQTLPHLISLHPMPNWDFFFFQQPQPKSAPSSRERSRFGFRPAWMPVCAMKFRAKQCLQTRYMVCEATRSFSLAIHNYVLTNILFSTPKISANSYL